MTLLVVMMLAVTGQASGLKTEKEPTVVSSDTVLAAKTPLQQIDSGFNYARGDLSISGDLAAAVKDRSAKACYVGKVTQVCDVLRDMERAGNTYYSEGNHDLTQLLTCNVVGSEVLISYLMTTDYDDYEIHAEKVLYPCR